MTNEELQELKDQAIESIYARLRKFVGEPNCPELFEKMLREALNNRLLRKLADEVRKAKYPQEVYDFEVEHEGDKMVLNPKNLYTAVCMVQQRIGLKTLQEMRVGTLSKGLNAQGEYLVRHPVTGFGLLYVMWSEEKGFLLRTMKPADNITLDFVIDPEGKLKEKTDGND